MSPQSGMATIACVWILSDGVDRLYSVRQTVSGNRISGMEMSVNTALILLSFHPIQVLGVTP